MKINVIGQILGPSGYSQHTRGLINALYKINKEIHLDVPLMPGWEVQVTDAELEMIKSKHYEDGVTVMITIPQMWPQGMVEKQKKFYGFCVWEGDKVPKGWVDLFAKCDGILVPSKHVKDAIINTEGVTEKVVSSILTIPHGVDTEIFKPQKKSTDKFVFCANKGWAQGQFDRGGVQFLLKAFAEEFRANENVSLRLKINPAYCPPGWNLDNELRALNLPKDRPLIEISVANLPSEKLPIVYEGDCFVSPTMAEAFSLPCAEAMACGLPVISTCYGGQCDYLLPDFSWLVDYKLVPVVHDVAYEGVQWAVPDINDLRKKMRYAFENQEECKKKGKIAREYAKANLTWDLSARKLLEALKE